MLDGLSRGVQWMESAGMRSPRKKKMKINRIICAVRRETLSSEHFKPRRRGAFLGSLMMPVRNHH